MRRRTLLIVACVTVALTGCAAQNENAQRQASIAEQALPGNIADPPSEIDIPHWGVRNPHFHVTSNGRTIQISSTSHGWNGQYIDIYYVPYANVNLDYGDYALHSRYSPQRIATARMKQNQTWGTTWDTKNVTLPQSFYILVKTNTGQVNIERVIHTSGRYVDGGAESPVH